MRHRLIWAGWGVGFLLLLGAEVEAGDAMLPSVSAIAPAHLTPDRRDPTVAEAWRAAEAFEEARAFADAATARRRVLAQRPRDVHTLWRLARDLVNQADTLPRTAITERRALVEEARAFAARGTALAPRCAECRFYQFVATAQIAGYVSRVEAFGLIREAGDLLDACLADPPMWRDANGIAEATNLAHAAAVFLRAVPDSRWLRMVGVRGDLERSLALARDSVAAAPDRLDFRVELGTGLLCQASRARDAHARAEGAAVLRAVRDAAPGRRGDAVHQSRARWLLGSPERACSDHPLDAPPTIATVDSLPPTALHSGD